MTRLELADCYYTVARDLDEKANKMLIVAALLNREADQLCEANMRETPMPSAAPAVTPAQSEVKP